MTDREDILEPPRAGPGSEERPGDVVGELQARLGLAIADGGLAMAALTHKSFVNEHRGEGLQDNERLEFLGDAVIDLAVSHRLMEHFPGAREGELSKIRAAVVDEAGLAAIARELGLGALLRLGRGEELTHGREKSSILADAMEAVVAALYLGGGLAPVLALIDRFLGDAFARAAAGTLDRDYKTQLQELAHSRLRASPRYRVVAEHGPDHSKVFDVELELKGEVISRGAGRSKKDAEQAAAKLALTALTARLAAARPADEAAQGCAPAPEASPPAGALEPSVRPDAAAADGAGSAAAGAGLEGMRPPGGPELAPPVAVAPPPALAAPAHAAPPATPALAEVVARAVEAPDTGPEMPPQESAGAQQAPGVQKTVAARRGAEAKDVADVQEEGEAREEGTGAAAPRERAASGQPPAAKRGASRATRGARRAPRKRASPRKAPPARSPRKERPSGAGTRRAGAARKRARPRSKK